LNLPAGDLASGQYLLIVQALDSTDKVLAEAAPVKTPYQRPSAIQAVLTWLKQTPLAIAGLGGLCCLTVIGVAGLFWFVMPKRRDRTKTVDLVLPQKERRAAPVMERPEARRGPPRSQSRSAVLYVQRLHRRLQLHQQCICPVSGRRGSASRFAGDA
jgi:hypothetical protein